MPTWDKDEFLFFDNGNYGVFLYNISEYRMMGYAAEFAIFEKNNSKAIFNFKKNRIEHSLNNPVNYFQKSECFVVKKLMGENIPFLIIKPKERKFSFLKFDNSSIYFNFSEIEKDQFELSIKDETQVKRLKLEFFEGGKIDFAKLEWYPFDEFESFVL